MAIKVLRGGCSGGPANDKSSWPFELQTQLVPQGGSVKLFYQQWLRTRPIAFWGFSGWASKAVSLDRRLVHSIFRVEISYPVHLKVLLVYLCEKLEMLPLHCKWWHIYQVFSDINHHRAHRAISDTLHVFRELLGLSLSLDQITRTPGRKRWTPHENLDRWVPPLQILDSQFVWAPETCISNIFPHDTDVAGSETLRPLGSHLQLRLYKENAYIRFRFS